MQKMWLKIATVSILEGKLKTCGCVIHILQVMRDMAKLEGKTVPKAHNTTSRNSRSSNELALAKAILIKTRD